MPVDGGSRPLDCFDVDVRDGSSPSDALVGRGGADEPIAVDDPFAGSTGATSIVARLAELQQQVEQLEGALRTQRQISVVVGILAERLGCSTAVAWSVVVRLSQTTNIRVREITRVIGEAYDGRGRAEDAELLTHLMSTLPDARSAVTEDERG